jgi:hypothetical protein
MPIPYSPIRHAAMTTIKLNIITFQNNKLYRHSSNSSKRTESCQMKKSFSEDTTLTENVLTMTYWMFLKMHLVISSQKALEKKPYNIIH